MTLDELFRLTEEKRRQVEWLSNLGQTSALIGQTALQRKIFDELSATSVTKGYDQLLQLRKPVFDRPRYSIFDQHIKELEKFKSTLDQITFLSGSKTISAVQGSLPNTVVKFQLTLPPQQLARYDKLNELLATGNSAFRQNELRPFLPVQNDFDKVFRAIRFDGLQASLTSQVLESMTGLSILGNVICSSPFEQATNIALKPLLGDFSKINLLDNRVLDCHGRAKLYTDIGLNKRLTMLPEPAFTQTLSNVGIIQPGLYTPVFQRFDSDEAISDGEVVDEEVGVKKRMLRSFDILRSFEVKLREFIDDVMTAEYGPRWVKQRVPEPLRKCWIEARDAALKKGESAKPLIWYADFTHYLPIITRKDNWSQLFEDRFSCSNVIEIQASFQMLYPIRICTMHAREISKDDFLLLTALVHRILKAAGKMGNDEEL